MLTRARFLSFLMGLALYPQFAAADAQEQAAELSPQELQAQQLAFFQELFQSKDDVEQFLGVSGLVELEAPEAEAAIGQALQDSNHNKFFPSLFRLAFQSNRPTFQKAANDAILKKICSEDPSEIRIGHHTLTEYFSQEKVKEALLQATIQGSPVAQAKAIELLLRMYPDDKGPIWPLFEQVLLKAPHDRDFPQEFAKLFQTQDQPPFRLTNADALPWAIDHLTDEQLGFFARILFSQIKKPTDKTKAKKFDSAVDALRKKYTSSDDFETRLPIAAALNLLVGPNEEYTRTLHAAISPRYQNQAGRQIGWQGMEKVRDSAVLGKVKPILLGNLSNEEAKFAYDWLLAWGKDKAEPQLFEILQEAASGDRRGNRLNALRVLAELKHRPSKEIFEADMREGAVEIRLAAAKGLARIAQKGDEAALGQLLRKEPEAKVKCALIQGLGQIASAESVAPLQFMLTHPSREVQAAAVQALIATRKPEAANAISILKNAPDLELRFSVWQFLLELQGDKALADFKNTALPWLEGPQIEQLAQNPHIKQDVLAMIARNGSDSQRTIVIQAARQHRKALIPELLHDPSFPDDLKAIILGEPNEGKAELDFCRQSLKSESKALQQSALQILGHDGQKEDLDLLTPFLQSQDRRTKAFAIITTHQIQKRFSSKGGSKKRKSAR